MKNAMKRAVAFLITLLMVLNIAPISAPAENTGEHEPLALRTSRNTRPYDINIQLEWGQDSITLQEIAESVNDDGIGSFAGYYNSPNTVSFDGHTIEGLSSVHDGETGSISIYNWDANDGDGEWAFFITFVPAAGWDPRPHEIDIQLNIGQDSIGLQEVCEAAGETYTNDMAFYYPDPNTINVSDDRKTLTNLSSIAEGQNGRVGVYDFATNEWAIWADLIPTNAKYYCVRQVGEVSQADILDAAGVTVSTYDNYFLIPYDLSVDYSQYLELNVTNHKVKFLTTDLPQSGLIYKLVPNVGGTCPFLLVFVGDNDIRNANDGIFTYRLNETAGTATITGFVYDLGNEKKTDVEIPATMTWPKNNGSEYRVTAIDGNAFKNESDIQTVTIKATNLTVGKHAFQGCTGLTSVKDSLSDGVLTIGEYAFAECANLKYFDSDAGVDKIYGKAFFNDTALVRLKAGAGKKTQLVNEHDGQSNSNAFQYCSGELFFNGGISNLGYLSFYDSKVTKITTISIDYAWNSISGWLYQPQIDLVLNVKQISNGDLTQSQVNNLLRYTNGFINITLNLKQGVETVSTEAFSGYNFDNCETLTVNVDTEDNDAEITVQDGAIPASKEKLTVNFRVNRVNVTGADTEPLPALERIGRITYLDSKPLDIRYHDDVFWYELENGKAYITGLYDDNTTELTFISASQGNVYNSEEEKMDGMVLTVAGIKALPSTIKGHIKTITFNNSKSFVVEKDSLNEMSELRQISINLFHLGCRQHRAACRENHM